MKSAEIDKVTKVRREYQKKWRAKNKDKVKEYNRRFWEKRAEKAATVKTAAEEGKKKKTAQSTAIP